MADTILQHPIATGFVYPFLLIFFIVFAILEKTKVLGDDKKQLNAFLSFVIGLIFISVVSPKLIVGNLILFLTIALVVLFVVLLLWGFLVGDSIKIEGKAKWRLGGLVALGVVIALLSILDLFEGIFDFLFKQSWSSSFWTNVLFILAIAAALAIALKSSKSS